MDHAPLPQELWNQQIDLSDVDGRPTVADLPDAISEVPSMKSLGDIHIPTPHKDPVEQHELEHRDFEEECFWQRLPAFARTSEDEFREWRFQNRHTITSGAALKEVLQGVAPVGFLDDVEAGLRRSPMNLRISPYLLSLIDWNDPWNDPIRIQFLPTASTFETNHPMLTLDSLHELKDSPVEGLVHRYPDKVLFLPLDVCPAYCRFCTRSYAIGADTETVEKHSYQVSPGRWKFAYAYIASRPEVEDVVVSGGDTFMLAPAKLREIGNTLLDIPHVRRIRFATKGPAVIPMKLLTHQEWTDALVELVDRGRSLNKEVCLHTHFNSENEITRFSMEAMSVLFQSGVQVRNQSVMIRGVNDDADHMRRLIRRLSFLNVQPYYVYQHDMVSEVDELRTTVATTREIERRVRGTTAGFNTPTFVNDVPGGGGKRDIHSFEHYDEVTGVSVYRSPGVDEQAAYLYFDPISQLCAEGQERWADPIEHEAMAREALRKAGLRHSQWVR